MYILVTGASGQVGQELQFLAKQHMDMTFLFADKGELDITNSDAVAAYFNRHSIDYCINCAAYTAVDKAEEAQDICKKINTDAVEYLAKTCELHGATFIQYSTDYVYHAASNQPYKENQAANPQSVYAQTKLAGDLVALKHCQKTIILRTSWVYSSVGHNFVKTMLHLSTKMDTLRVVFDQIGTPTYARDLAKATLEIIKKLEQTPQNLSYFGIYNYSNEGVTSWYDFATAIFDIKNIPMSLHPIESKDYPTPAARPHFSVMNKEKIRNTFGLNIPHWRIALKECLELL
jgi:dTDP-4-dehydrorhamnose reductase